MSRSGAPPHTADDSHNEEEDSDVFIDIEPRSNSDAVRPLLKHQTSSDSVSSAAAGAAATALSNMVRTPVSSGHGSRAPSPHGSNYSSEGDDVQTNVSEMEQLEDLPEECLSGNPNRPLQHFDEDGNVFQYALKPMMYSVFMILLMEGIERFSFYGINYTQTSYLTGSYDSNWNANMNAISASSYVSISVAVAYTTPFFGALLADRLLGDYWSILTGTLVFYLPGLSLIALTTVPGLLGEEFNNSALAFGLLVLWPIGTGIVKSIVNVFGAKQFHPLLQSSLIEAYYVKFYMCINVGALIGGVLVPLLAQENVTLAYFLPVCMLFCGIVLFTAGTSRYVRTTPDVVIMWKALWDKKKRKKAPVYTPTNNSSNDISLAVISRVSVLIVPFSIVYSQMSTTFIVQGTVMKKAFGFIDAACMNNADAVAVLIFGHFIGNGLYPWCAARGIKIPTTYKFAIGSAFGAASIAWAILVEHMIHSTHAATGERVNIMWQAVAYILIGVGEIFAVSAAYEVAFTASPPEKKVLFSAMNLFCIGGLPSVICIALYQLCIPWFQNSDGTTNISHLKDYTTAHVNKYFWLLFLISIFGTLVNLIPSVRRFVESVEEQATDMVRTPKTPMQPPRRESVPDEDSVLLKAQRHQYYLKYGSAPTLFKQGSMRAGSTRFSVRADPRKEKKQIKRQTLSKLYQSVPALPGVGSIMKTGGKPFTMAGAKSKRTERSSMPPRVEDDLEAATSD